MTHNIEIFSLPSYCNGDLVGITYKEVARVNAEMAKLQAELAKCREALRMVEWLESEEGDAWCSWCLNDKDEGHTGICPRQAALESSHE
jgi:hypothetical protein